MGPSVYKFLDVFRFRSYMRNTFGTILNYNLPSKVKRFTSISTLCHISAVQKVRSCMAKDCVWPNSLLTSFDMSGLYFIEGVLKDLSFW